MLEHGESQTPLVLEYEDQRLGAMSFVAPGLEFYIGSGDTCALRIRDPMVHERHARIFWLLNSWWIEPADPQAGVFVKRSRIREPEPLAPSTTIRIGPTRLRPVLPSAPSAPATPDGKWAYSDVDPLVQPATVDESYRLQMLFAIRRAIEHQADDALIPSILSVIDGLFPVSDMSELVLNTKQELIAHASSKPGPSAVSFTLALRCARSRKALLWERRIASDRSQAIPSLNAITSAIYCPVFHEQRLLGLLAVSSKRLHPPLGHADVPVAIEGCRLLSRYLPAALAGGALGRPPTVFLSYARERGAVARAIASSLRRSSISVWLDDRIEVGERWRDAILDAVTAVDVIIVAVTRAALASRYVQWEIQTAHELRKPVLPLLIEDCDLPEPLAAIQHLDLTGGLEPDALARLAERVRQLSTEMDGGRDER